MKRPKTAAELIGTPAVPTPSAGIESVRIRANCGDARMFVEVAILDPKKPRELELTIISGDAMEAFALIDVGELLSAIQVLRQSASTVKT